MSFEFFLKEEESEEQPEIHTADFPHWRYWGTWGNKQSQQRIKFSIHTLFGFWIHRQRKSLAFSTDQRIIIRLKISGKFPRRKILLLSLCKSLTSFSATDLEWTTTNGRMKWKNPWSFQDLQAKINNNYL